eukprot:365658-Chlamydomonas_euryale.AAC.2
MSAYAWLCGSQQRAVTRPSLAFRLHAHVRGRRRDDSGLQRVLTRSGRCRCFHSHPAGPASAGVSTPTCSCPPRPHPAGPASSAPCTSTCASLCRTRQS